MSVLIFNHRSSASFHAHIAEPPEYKIPEREFSTFRRDGYESDVIIDSGQYQNVDMTYKMNMDASDEELDYRDVASKITTWLHPRDPGVALSGGYYRLQDSYDRTHYRLAKFKGGDSISNIYNKAGEFDLSFTCKPQRFLLTGEKGIILETGTTKSFTITNPTDQIALPVIDLESCEKVNIVSGGEEFEIRIEDPDNFDTIDSRNETLSDDSYSNVKFYTIDEDDVYETYLFPKLYPGVSTITITPDMKEAGITATCTIIPNWWEL